MPHPLTKEEMIEEVLSAFANTEFERTNDGGIHTYGQMSNFVSNARDFLSTAYNLGLSAGREEERKEISEKLNTALSSAYEVSKYPTNNPYIHLKDHIRSILSITPQEN